MFAAPKQKSTRAKPTDWEGQEQVTLLSEIELRHPAAFKLIYHPANGGHRHKLVAIKLKKQGVKAGVPDLVLPMARGGYFGLYIEFKATPPHDSPVSASQDAYIQGLISEGYLAVVCRGWRDAMEVLGNYLKQTRTAVAA
ncbi:MULTISPECIES: VRR-NUC domain-containing protein [unclassified Pseudomonas]|uniref:VRR-NUC domain-containing protein n=1 Tax=unclassified Pseudomonas TaxID=196821 RepID=UPI002E822086|nr:VRR-NUC domain-containing protein [Pseudomonas sp. 10C3]MEE3507762.1 VRR-NUC domain-containing protein [Pseudomonas sp. 10C3]